MPAQQWRVVDGKFIDGGNAVSGSCHHRKQQSACGGCYYRLIFALQQIYDASADAGGAIAGDVLAALQKEWLDRPATGKASDAAR